MKRYIIGLTDDERGSLEALCSKRGGAADRAKRARIVLLADAGSTDAEIVEQVGVGISTVERTRRSCVLDRLVQTVDRKPKPQERRGKLDGAAEAKLAHLACTDPPAGRARWTLRLLAAELVELEVIDSVSHETVRQVLKKTNSNLGVRAASVSRPRRTPPSSPQWRTSSTSTNAHSTRAIPSSA
jgi:transposase